MKKLLLNALFLLIGFHLSAQCDKPFISEYVEGYSSNKALEIYNPTDVAINLSAYWIMRFSNGSNSAGDLKKIQLPDVMLEPYDAFVVVVDKTDMSLWASDLDKPVWNGYNVLDTIFDDVTGLPIFDNGVVRIGAQYDADNNALFGTEYNELYDLQCKADAFMCPVYAVNNTMYFNGNDAIALVEGADIDQTGSNLLDVIGVIGEDPTMATAIMSDAWTNFAGFWLTKDQTLVRKSAITTGRNNITDVTLGGSFTGTEWLSYRKNNFEFLGQHKSACEPNSLNDAYSCMTSEGYVSPTLPLSNNVASNKNLNVIQFRMFPNPNAISTLEIEADARIENVQIYNIAGQFLSAQANQNGGDEMSLDLTGLDAGMFLIRINFPDGHYSIQKLIRQ